MDGIDLMATAMQAMKARLDVAAGNLANASSDGFQRRIARITLGPSGLAMRTVADATRGALRRTGRAFDLAATSGGGFVVRDVRGKERLATSGSFVRDARGEFVDRAGSMLLGERGALRALPEATVDERGVVREDGAYAGQLRLAPGTIVESGALAASNVDAIHEMVDVLTAQRAFETAEKALGALDDARAKAANDVGRVKS
jgi:flagellar basal-body rod protein FlgF